ncbi:hypothetical protein FKM82_019497 [Ascaphus truei]
MEQREVTSSVTHLYSLCHMSSCRLTMRSAVSLINEDNWKTRGCRNLSTYRDNPSPKDPMLANIGQPGGSTSDLWIFGRWWNTGITGCGQLRNSHSL